MISNHTIKHVEIRRYVEACCANFEKFPPHVSHYLPRIFSIRTFEFKKYLVSQMKTIDKQHVPGFAEFKLKVDTNDTNTIPLLMVNIYEESDTSQDVWGSVQSIFDKYYTDNQKCRMVIDLSKTQMLFSMPYMQQWSNFFKHNRKYLREHVKYVAFISENTLFASLFNMMININKPQIPFYVIKSKADIQP